ncbi:ClpP/crotonase-like domain-containing protein [Tribonema minus]|uniref:ClpP/crotonase-like domain-containing protein n=1 Tax=Tribonema minus TaxID=303371 RepID=A0A835Z1L9_9STRA|nr:ClpP/crotonase-like domain-containing protein [Tribonema minus]
MGAEFMHTVAEISKACHKGKVRAAVLTGAGKAFSAGGDTAWLMRRHDDEPERNSHIMRDFYRSFLCIRDLPVPIIAAINGHAIGAGLCLAMACDVRVVALSAKLGLTFVSLGIHPGMACTHFLPRLVGPQAAKKLLLTADTVTGSEALELGLVSEATEGDDVFVRACMLAARIAENSPVAVQQTVKTLRMAEEEHLDHALQREADAQALCYASNDLTEGILANKERRTPSFKGAT